MKKNEAINLNNKAVLDEEKQANDPEFLKRMKKEKWEAKKKDLEEELKFKGIDENKIYLNQPALKYDGFESENKKKKEVFGWNVFNDDTLYNAYEKRCKSISFYKDVYEKQMENKEEDYKPNEEMLQNLVDDIEKQ